VVQREDIFISAVITDIESSVCLRQQEQLFDRETFITCVCGQQTNIEFSGNDAGSWR
jgi:hypothetical protein